jgi:NAD(P)-dependent dehydrogenase (short-subunit alcohol dehydrogenase family)
MTGAVLPLLRRSARARIVNVTSGLGSVSMLADPNSPWADHAGIPYASSKAALDAISLSYAKDLRAAGIGVAAVSPGHTATDLNAFTGFRTPAEAAATVLEVAFGPDPEPVMYSERGPIPW